MARFGERVGDFAQMRGLDQNASFPSVNSSFIPRAGCSSSSEAKEINELQKKASGQPIFCALCGRTFYSKFQAAQHMRGKSHLKRMKHLSNNCGFSVSGLNQNTLPAEMANERIHKTFGKQVAKRMADDTERHWQSKKQKLDTASQPKFSQLHLHYKSPLALPNECDKGLVMNMCIGNSRKLSCNPSFTASHNPSLTASLELDGKTYNATGNSKRMARQLLAETLISEMEQDIEKIHVKLAAVRLAFQNKDESEESVSRAYQEVLQRPPPFDTITLSSDDIDLTSNDDICSSTASSTFNSVFMSASGQQFESSNSIAPTSDYGKLESRVNIENSAVSSAESLAVNKVGMPSYHRNLAKIARLKKRKLKKKKFLYAIDGKNPIVTLNELFKDEVSFQFHSHLAPEMCVKHYCIVSVAGMTFEGCDSLKKNAKKRAAFAAVAVLKGNGMYDQKIAEQEALRTGRPVQQTMLKQRVPSLAISARSSPAACTEYRPLPISRLKRVFPGSIFTVHAEKFDLNLKCKIFTIDVLIGDQRFVGNGKRLKFARADASKKALRAFGLWTDLDDKAEEQFHVLSEIEKKNQGFHLTIPPADGSFEESFLQPVLHKKKLASGRGKKGRASRRIRGNNSLAFDSSSVGAENYGSNDIPIGGNYYGKGNKSTSFMNSGVERGCNKDSNVLIGGSFYHTGDEQVRFIGSGVERRNDNSNDILIGGNYYGKGNKPTSFLGSGVEIGCDENNNYYGRGNKPTRFISSGVARGCNENSNVLIGDSCNDSLIGASFYDTGDKPVNFVGSTFSSACRNEGGVPSSSNDINSRLWNVAFGISTGSSVSAVEKTYQNNEYEQEPVSSYFTAGDPCDLIPSGNQSQEEHL